MKIFDRIEKARISLRLNKGEVCERLGIGRTMLHYLKTEERDLGMPALRELEKLESEARIHNAVDFANAHGGSQEAFDLKIMEDQDSYGLRKSYTEVVAENALLKKQLSQVKDTLAKLMKTLGADE